MHEPPNPYSEKTAAMPAADMLFEETGVYIPETVGPIPSAPVADASAAFPMIPGYDILGVLGRGGMGVVYRAYQRNLSRPVALKMILSGKHSDDEDVERFRAEAKAVGRLVHPNIVQIYEMGEHEGYPYFSLEFVGGGTLSGKLAGEPQPARTAAAIVETLARAVHYAHTQGIVHRDLKPANVLLQPDPGLGGLGVPKIADFGLAKQIDTDSGRTRSGTILGTPSYMAPEQASGRSHEVGPGADVYALGAILYNVLTGRPPFRGTTMLDTLEQVRSLEPVPPTQLQPGAPRDLETICLKCLHKQSAGRYATALELADDLRRFLNGEPIRARPVSAFEKAWRWCGRNKWLAGLAGALAAMVLVAIIAPTVLAMQLKSALDASEQDRKDKVLALNGAEATLSDSYAASGHMANGQGRPGEAMLWFANAARTSEADPERRTLNNLRVRTWERSLWTPSRALPHPGKTLTRFAFHIGSRHLMTFAKGNSCVVWDLATERPVQFSGLPSEIVDACWSPNGEYWAVAAPGGVELRSFPSGYVLDRLPDSAATQTLAFNPDGKILAVGGDRLRLWDCENRRWLPGAVVHPNLVLSIGFATQTGLVATGTDEDVVRVFEWSSSGLAEKPLFTPTIHYSVASLPSAPGARAVWPDRYFSPQFASGDRELFTMAGGEWHRVDARNGRQLSSTTVDGALRFMRQSPDGKHLVFCGYEGQARIWDVGKQSVVASAPPHGAWGLAAAFSPDSRQVVIAGMDHKARVCSVPEAWLFNEVDVGEEVWDVEYAPVGRSFATSSPSGTVRVWSAPSDVASFQMPALFSQVESSEIVSPNGQYILPCTYPRANADARVVDVATGKPVGVPMPFSGRIMSTCFSSDGERVAFADYIDASKDRPHSGSLQVWDWRKGQRVFSPVSLSKMPTKPTGVAFNPNGKQIIVTGEWGWILNIDAATGAIRRELEHKNLESLIQLRHRRVLFAPDGRTFATAGVGLAAHVWDAETGKLRYPALVHEQGCVDLDFSPDSALLLTASYDGKAHLWDVATGKPHGPPLEHGNWVYQARFSGDGKSIVTASRDHSVRVWDVETGQLLGSPMEHAGEVYCAAFSTDGRWVFTGTTNGTIGAWDRRTCKAVTPRLWLGDFPCNFDVALNGASVVASCSKNLLVWDWKAWKNNEPTKNPNELCEWAELVSMKKLVEGGGIADLTNTEWLDRWHNRRNRQSPQPAP